MNSFSRLFLLSIIFFTSHRFSWSEEFENIPKLIVRGEASLFKPADQMEVSLGVVTLAEDSSQALNENNQRMRRIISNLVALGLDESDYQTGRFQIRPIYKKPSKNSSEEEKTIINQYEVSNIIQIKTKKIDLADRILNAASQGGANQVTKVNFNINNPQTYKEEVIKLATQNALADAKALANAAGVEVKRVLNISLDNWVDTSKAITLASKNLSNLQEQEGVSEVLEPGQAELHATVNMTFEIGSL